MNNYIQLIEKQAKKSLQKFKKLGLLLRHFLKNSSIEIFIPEYCL